MFRIEVSEKKSVVTFCGHFSVILSENDRSAVICKNEKENGNEESFAGGG